MNQIRNPGNAEGDSGDSRGLRETAKGLRAIRTEEEGSAQEARTYCSAGLGHGSRR